MVAPGREERYPHPGGDASPVGATPSVPPGDTVVCGVFISGSVSHLELAWEEPYLAIAGRV